jgi:hypothetical protein
MTPVAFPLFLPEQGTEISLRFKLRHDPLFKKLDPKADDVLGCVQFGGLAKWEGRGLQNRYERVRLSHPPVLKLGHDLCLLRIDFKNYG